MHNDWYGREVALMAQHFIAYCEDCQIDGPFVRCASDTAYLAARGLVRREAEAEIAWAAFMGEHAHHDLRLRTEGL